MMAYFYCMAYIGCFILGLFIGGVAGFIDGNRKEKKRNSNGSKEHNSKM